jgi:hypothetical protein
VAVAGSRAYVVEWAIDPTQTSPGLQVIDISDPTNPRRFGRRRLISQGGQSIAIAGDQAYVAGSGLDVVDIRDPFKLSATLHVASFASAVATLANHAYVAAAETGLQVFQLRPDGWIQVDPDHNSGEFRARVHGTAGQSLFIQRSANLREWEDWKEITLRSASETISDGDADPATWRFYRARPAQQTLSPSSGPPRILTEAP